MEAVGEGSATPELLKITAAGVACGLCNVMLAPNENHQCTLDGATLRVRINRVPEMNELTNDQAPWEVGRWLDYLAYDYPREGVAS